MGKKTRMNRLLVVFPVALIVGIWSFTALVDTAWAKPGGGKPGGKQNPTYGLVSLGEQFGAEAINNAGTIVGVTFGGDCILINPVDTNGDGEGDLWFADIDGDGLNDLAETIIATSATRLGSVSRDISDSGQVVGHNRDADNNYTGFTIVPLDTDGDGVGDTWHQDLDGDGENDLMVLLPSPYLMTTFAFGVNMDGNIVGGVELPSGERRAAIWTGGLAIDLGTLGGAGSFAYAINDLGEVAGRATDASGRERAYLLRPLDADSDGAPDTWFVDAGDGITNALMIDLGTLGGAQSSARDINNNAQIIGSADNAEAESTPVIWEIDEYNNTTVNALGAPDRLYNHQANAINRHGAICGYGLHWVRVPGGGRRDRGYGWLYDNGSVTEFSELLGVSDPVFASVDINDSGLVAGHLNGAGGALAIPLP